MDGENPVGSKGYPDIKQVVNSSLRAILSGSYANGQINELVSACHALALPYVRRRLASDSVLRPALELNLADFAYDCIADLFAFAQTGEFPHFHAYFAAFPPDKLSEEELIAHLRRLVFSQVNQGLFRLYNDVDPSLGKVIRNIKLALRHFDSLVLVERFGEPSLTPSAGDRLPGQRSLAIDELESGLRRYLRGSENIPYMLGKLALFLQEQTEASRVVSLTSAAIVFRTIYGNARGNEEPQEPVDRNLDSDYLARIVNEAVEKTRSKMSGEYSRKKKISVGLLDTYFVVIEKRLILTFSGDGAERGLRELLAEEMEGMTGAEYRSKHRSRLEYLSRLTGEEVKRILGAK